MRLFAKIKINLIFKNFKKKSKITMTVLHHKVNILKITDNEIRKQLEHSTKIQKAVIMKLDENHWLVDNSMIKDIENVCHKFAISLKQTFEF